MDVPDKGLTCADGHELAPPLVAATPRLLDALVDRLSDWSTCLCGVCINTMDSVIVQSPA